MNATMKEIFYHETFIFEDYILLRRPNINLNEQKSNFLQWSDKLKCKNEA